MRRSDSDQRLMFFDTHCHLAGVKERGIDDMSALFLSMAEKNGFLLDIGTAFDDFPKRVSMLEKTPNGLRLLFSAGIFPDDFGIDNRAAQFDVLKKIVADETANFGKKRLAAIGECGIDLHRSQNLDGQRELFAMQLDLTKSLDLPVVVHSRDAFDATFQTISSAKLSRKNGNGVIHCFSYSIGEARSFLDAGFFISLAGNVTYGGKSRLAAMRDLLRFLPSDRILLETDSPHLPPRQHRGETNTPLLIDETYRFVAEARGIECEKLCSIAEENVSRLFAFNP